MDNYKLYNVVKPLLAFLEELTNWYVRLNRSRMKGEEGLEDQKKSLNILFDVLLNTCILMSCITPFITETMYQNLRNGISPTDKSLNQDSIHFLQIPDVNEDLLDQAVEARVSRMISAIENGRLIRERKNISLKTPLSQVVIVDADPVAQSDFKTVEYYILEELNCLEMRVEGNEDEYVTYRCEPDNKLIGQALKKDFNKDFKQKLATLPSS
jgi:isoleucyl-tRNA synthetase